MATPEEEDLLTYMRHASENVDKEVEEVLRLGRASPLSEEESRRLLTRICENLKDKSNMPKTADEIAAFVEEMLQKKKTTFSG